MTLYKVIHTIASECHEVYNLSVKDTLQYSAIREHFTSLNTDKDISVVSPVYLSSKSIPELVESLISIISPLTEKFEILLVDDRSPDDSWAKIEKAAKKYTQVKGIKLSKNFGQHKAISAGLSQAKGEYTFVIDCDLQDNPKHIPELLSLALNGYDIVYTKKQKRKHGLLKNISAKIFSLLFNLLTNDPNREYDTEIGCYSLITRKVRETFSRMSDRQRHYLMLLRWLGFSSTYLSIEHEERKYGKSSYTLKKLIHHAVDGLTSESDRLLYFSIYVGLTFFVLSTLIALWISFNYFIYGYKEGWGSLIVTILLSTGVITFFLGINGVYLSKNFEQTKMRPLFIIDKTT